MKRACRGRDYYITTSCRCRKMDNECVKVTGVTPALDSRTFYLREETCRFAVIIYIIFYT